MTSVTDPIYKDPSVPGYIKLVFALRDAGRDLSRPAMSAACIAFALYLVNHFVLGDVEPPAWMKDSFLELMVLLGSPAGLWGSSRFVEKVTSILKGQP